MVEIKFNITIKNVLSTTAFVILIISLPGSFFAATLTLPLIDSVNSVYNGDKTVSQAFNYSAFKDVNATQKQAWKEGGGPQILSFMSFLIGLSPFALMGSIIYIMCFTKFYGPDTKKFVACWNRNWSNEKHQAESEH